MGCVCSDGMVGGVGMNRAGATFEVDLQFFGVDRGRYGKGAFHGGGRGCSVADGLFALGD